MLANFNKARILTKYAVDPKSRKNQKNRCTTVKMALTNLKRSGFVFEFANAFIYCKRTKRSAAVFLMCIGYVQKAHCWIDKALWVLWRSKVPCHRGIERKKNSIINCVHTVGLRGNDDRIRNYTATSCDLHTAISTMLSASCAWPGRFPPEKARKSLQFPLIPHSPRQDQSERGGIKQGLRASMLPQ